MESDRSETRNASVHALADEREMQLAAWEARLNERENVADERERRLAAWEAKTDERARVLGQFAPSRQQRSYEAIERTRHRVLASLERLDRSEAALRRTDAHSDREQDTIESETADSERLQTYGDPVAQEVLEARARRLHMRCAAMASMLVTAQNRLAGEYEQLARQQPSQATKYQRRAERARQKAADLHAAELAEDQ